MEPTLVGRGFQDVPDNAIGIASSNNNSPLEYINTESAGLMMQITEKSETRMSLTQGRERSHAVPLYLGAIVSADRQTVYWVNNTQPLP